MTTQTITVGSKVFVHLAEHCDEPTSLGWGTVEFAFPGGHTFTVRFPELRSEVVARYKIKEVAR